MAFWKSNIIETERIETTSYSNKVYFSGEYFFIFKKLNNQCKVDIIFIKSFYLNGNTEFYEIILAIPEIFYTFEKLFFFVKINCRYHFPKSFFFK